MYVDTSNESYLGSGPNRFLDPFIPVKVGLIDHGQGGDIRIEIISEEVVVSLANSVEETRTPR